MRTRHVPWVLMLLVGPGLAPPEGGAGSTASAGDARPRLLEAGVDGTNIYQKIKDVDDGGLSVAREGGGNASGADILLDEQGEATGGRGHDAAPNPLFKRVAGAKLGAGTYPEFIALLDDYVVKEGEAESYSPQEQAEIDRFLDEAVATRPMRLAFAYIRDGLGEGLSEAAYREEVEKIWFELFTNRFGGKVTPFCSGFEHVFVGEGKFNAGGGGRRRGEISGYHSWVKFFLDEKEGKVNYIGHKYDIPASRRPADPCVVTLRMLEFFDEDGPGGRPEVELFKPKGGFFVGVSPECVLAMGTVAFHENRKGLLQDDVRRVVLDGDSYDLVLHRSVEEGGRKAHIRTFFPVLLGVAGPGGAGSDTGGTSGGGNVGGGGEGLQNDGPVVIVRALPNPEGEGDETGEFVELKNTTGAEIDLGDFELRDRQGRPRELEGVLAAGATRRFEIPRDRFEMRLGNDGGEIRLFRGSEQVAGVRYNRAASGQVVEFAR